MLALNRDSNELMGDPVHSLGEYPKGQGYSRNQNDLEIGKMDYFIERNIHPTLDWFSPKLPQHKQIAAVAPVDPYADVRHPL